MCIVQIVIYHNWVVMLLDVNPHVALTYYTTHLLQLTNGIV